MEADCAEKIKNSDEELARIKKQYQSMELQLRDDLKAELDKNMREQIEFGEMLGMEKEKYTSSMQDKINLMQ